MTERVNVEIAFRRSTRNSRVIIAQNVLANVGRGTGASLTSAAMLAAASPSAAAPMSAPAGPLPGPPGLIAVVAMSTPGTLGRSG